MEVHHQPPILGAVDVAGNLTASQIPSSVKLPTKGAKRLSKDPKPKPAVDSPSGTRFQCQRCPKNFSRIENLTRHQANHDDVGRFQCVQCRKRFTRSDLLNRHKRIHGTQAESTKSQGPLKVEFPHSPSGSAASDGQERSSYDGSSNRSNESPRSAGYQSYTQQPSYQILPNPAPTTQHQPMPHTQGLTSLMEAALAPEMYNFPPVENINPSPWDGFMRFGDTPTSYMGTYDADMSWTLNYLPPEQSSDYLLDHDMINSWEQFNDYSYQPVKYEEQPVPQQEPEDADGEEEDTSDWPDKVERPDSSRRIRDRIVPVRASPISWQTVLDEARSSDLSPSTIRPVERFSDPLRDSLLVTLNGASFKNEVSRPEIRGDVFPPSDVLDFFLRLYVRYIHPRFPVLHLPTFDIYNSSPFLLVVMMFLGSSHAQSDRGRFSRMFHEHLRIAMIRIQEVDKNYLRNVDNILTFFLLCLAGTWSGSKNSYEFAEGARGILITACRRSRLLDCRATARIEAKIFQDKGHNLQEATWLAWVETEKRKRLGLSVYIYDCQYPSLFNNQPYIAKAETTNCIFPCDESYWESHTSSAWTSLLGPSLSVQSTSTLLDALNCCLLPAPIRPPSLVANTRANEFGKQIIVYSLHTHIFDWRQATSMLNPTGLMGTANSAFDIGEGLRERRTWLVEALNSFVTTFQDAYTSVAAQILVHLGHVSLDVSLSDMHLVAGRSPTSNDAQFASENLKQWANSSLASSTMQHVCKLLYLCHSSIAAGTAADASYEITIGLFTGGMVCWAFAKLRADGGVNGGMIGREREKEMEAYVQEVRKASVALRQMGCWSMCSLFGRILEGFENGKVKGKEVAR